MTMEALTSDELAKNEARAIAMSQVAGTPISTRAALANYVDRSGKLRLRLMVEEQKAAIEKMKGSPAPVVRQAGGSP
jgi:hypothetical protein